MRSIVMRGVTFAILTIFLVIPLSVQTDTRPQREVYTEDFEDGEAQGWQLDPGWQVLQDEGNYVLSGEGHSWSRADKAYDNYRLSFRIKLLKGGVHLNYRLNDTGRYFIGFNTGNSYLGKQYWPDTFQDNLANGKRGHNAKQWTQIEIIGEGDTLTFVVDGNTEWTYTDPEPLLVGSFAFETLDNSQVYIDDIQVELSPSSDFIPDESLSSLTWVRTGGPLGGLGYDIRMMPDHPDTLLVSDAWAGVFISTNGGVDWGPSNEGITVRTGSTGDAIPIFCLTVDPTHPNIVWVGTQNTRGIFKSTDGGLTWERKDDGVVEVDGITFRGIAIDPTNSDVVYAAAEISSWIWNNGQPSQGREFDMVGGVVYKTTDGGEHWTETWRGQNLARYVWIDPRDTNVLYLSTGIFDREAANSNPQTGDPGGEGILKSTDGGATWRQINNGLNNLYVGSLFMNPANPDVLLAGTGNVQYPGGDGVYLSTDGGVNWKQVLQDQNIESVEFASSDPSIAYAGSSDAIFRSEDGGENWDLV
ncbi:MAG: family 16 glycoside hydrolase, partial [Anaerolineales bacterium]